jgi:hypothetical protein
MARYLIKQPDGRLALFSDGVNAWLRWDMSPDDVVDYYAERAAESARQAAWRDIEEVLSGEICGFAVTFAEANARHKASGYRPLPGPVDEELYAELKGPL